MGQAGEVEVWRELWGNQGGAARPQGLARVGPWAHLSVLGSDDRGLRVAEAPILLSESHPWSSFDQLKLRALLGRGFWKHMSQLNQLELAQSSTLEYL